MREDWFTACLEISCAFWTVRASSASWTWWVIVGCVVEWLTPNSGFWILYLSGWMVSHISIAIGFSCQGHEKLYMSCMWILGAWLLFKSGLATAKDQARRLPCHAWSSMAVLLCSQIKACECGGFPRLWLQRWDWRWVKTLEINHQYWDQFKPLFDLL